MAESTDKKTRKIAEKRVEPGKEFEGYQEAQNQLLAIQAEQQQNLALQANDAMNVQQQNQTLAQAAEVMAMDNLNPATQGILAGYGLNQPRVIKQSNTQRQGPNNITINNTTINNAAGPVQGREISIRPQEAGQSKFKAWLTNVFARQDAQWQKQNQEYARRESSLTRNSNKMMRKIEGLGKTIGSAMDPRKIANNVSNPLMNLLKSIGLVALAKRLPKILHFIDNAETTIKGWFSGIGNKIKSGLSGIFKDLNIKEVAQEFLHGLYNDSETGKLNLLLKDIEQWLEDRVQLSNRVVNGMDWTDKIGIVGAIRGLITWLGTFVGGEKYALKLQENDIKDDITDRINKHRSNLVDSDTRDHVGYDVGSGRISLHSGSMYGISTYTGQKLNDETINNSFNQYLKANGLNNKSYSEKQEIFKDWIKGKENEWLYTGESIILTQEVYNNWKAHLFIPEPYPDGDLNQFGGIPLNSVYSQLVVSWEIITEAYRGGTKLDRISGQIENKTYIENIIYLLKLLLDYAKIVGSVTVFPQLVKLLGLKENGPGVKSNTICIVGDRMDGNDRKRYVNTRLQFSRSYKKIIHKSDLGNRPKIPIAGKDFNGNTDRDEWTVYKLTASCIGDKLEAITGKKKVEYTEDYQKALGVYINSTANSIWKGENYGTHVYTYVTHEDYEDLYSDIKAKEEEREYRKKQKSLEKSSREAEEFLSSKNTDFVIEEKHDEDSKYSMPVVNMTEDTGLRLGNPDPVTGETGPAVVRNVTTAFGGNGSLTSNFKERREYGITTTNRRVAENGKEYRYHYGVDLANSEGGDVRLPARGTIKSSTYISKKKDGTSHIDIDNGDGTTTIFRHTKLADRFIDKDGKPIAGAEILPGEVVGTSEHHPNGAHIHLEVKNDKGACINPLNYFKPKLNDLKTTYQPEGTQSGAKRGDPTPEMQAISDKRELLSEFTDKLKTEIQKNTINPEFSSQNYFMSGITSNKTLTPKEFSSQRDKEEKELLKVLVEQVSLITQSSGYTASAISPLVDNMNAGFTMVAQSSKSTPAKTRANTLNTENEGIV